MLRRKSSFFTLVLMIGVTCFSQQKISLQNLYDSTFRIERLDQIHSMNDGQHYTVLNYDRNSRSTSLDQYSYQNLQKTNTIVNSLDLDEISWFSAYDFSDDESKVLLETQRIPIYRRSKKAIYYVYDIAAKTVTSVSQEPIQEPKFSPDGSKVAYVHNRNLFIKDPIHSNCNTRFF